MRKQNILIAAQQLNGGKKNTKNVVTPHVTPVGTEITEEEADKLGLDDKAVGALVERGFIVLSLVRTAGDGDEAGDEIVDGITGDEFMEFLDRHGIAYGPTDTLQAMLGIDPQPLNGVTLSALATFLDLHAISHPQDATAEDMLQLLLDHGATSTSSDDPHAAAAKAIEGSMDVKAIKDELTKLEVPFETDGNKPTLALLLARSRQPAAS